MQHAFTIRYVKRVNVLITKVGVTAPLLREEIEAQRPKPNEYVAIWDTGATHSSITKKVADELGLKPTGIVEVGYGNGVAQTNTYLVNILLPNNVTVGQVRVTEVKLKQDTNTPEQHRPQLLIGMDIIGMGDFAITSGAGNTILTFRTPSIKELDFIPETQDNNIMEGGNRESRRRLLRAKKHQTN